LERLKLKSAYRIAPFSMTLSNLQGHLPIASFSNATYQTVVHQLTRFQLIWRVRLTLYKSWAFYN